MAEKTRLSPFGDRTEEEYYEANGVASSSAYVKNSRGMPLYTKEWTPKEVDGKKMTTKKAVIFMCHGYGNNISWNLATLGAQIAAAGYLCCAIDYEGHGKSEGLRGYVPSLDKVVEDCIQYFDSVRERPENKGLPCFLYGESLGGAVSILIMRKQPDTWKGAVLLAPMCKIKESVKPPAWVVSSLSWLAYVIPWAAIVPTREVIHFSFKVAEKKELAMANPLRYIGRPRLGTAVELMRVTDFISARLAEVKHPFLIIHGTADVVTDPEVSQALYEQASSEDKTIKLYDGMCHALLFGDTDENSAKVFADILDWFNSRAR